MSNNIRGVRRAVKNSTISDAQKNLGKAPFIVMATPEQAIALIELASKYGIRNYRDTQYASSCKYVESDFREGFVLLWDGYRFIQGNPDRHIEKVSFDGVIRMIVLPKPTQINVDTSEGPFGKGIVTVYNDGHIQVGLRTLHISDIPKIMEAFDNLQ
jgi:hypothetical protein